MRPTAPDTEFLVFAKAAEAGAAKTRLIPVLGPEGAAHLHRRLLLHTLDTVHSVSDAVRLYCAPHRRHPFFAACAARHCTALEDQCGDDLGSRMLDACMARLRPETAVILLGADCAALTAAHLVRARDALKRGATAVVAPAEDGGYALIGLTRCARELFTDMPWGTGDVMARTRARLKRLGWAWEEIEGLWDVDRPADYERLCREGWLARLPA
jgi:uncharacterized protein